MTDDPRNIIKMSDWQTPIIPEKEQVDMAIGDTLHAAGRDLGFVRTKQIKSKIYAQSIKDHREMVEDIIAQAVEILEGD